MMYLVKSSNIVWWYMKHKHLVQIFSGTIYLLLYLILFPVCRNLMKSIPIKSLFQTVSLSEYKLTVSETSAHLNTDKDARQCLRLEPAGNCHQSDVTRTYIPTMFSAGFSICTSDSRTKPPIIILQPVKRKHALVLNVLCQVLCKINEKTTCNVT